MKRPKIEPAQQLAELLSDLVRTGRVRRRRGSYDEAEEIETRLQEWCDSIDDPREGCALLFDFFRGDDIIFGHCGVAAVPLGMIFTFTAKDRFTSFASRCPDNRRRPQAHTGAGGGGVMLAPDRLRLLKVSRSHRRLVLNNARQASVPDVSGVRSNRRAFLFLAAP